MTLAEVIVPVAAASWNASEPGASPVRSPARKPLAQPVGGLLQRAFAELHPNQSDTLKLSPETSCFRPGAG